jgi:methionyl aminopeptidase
MVKTPEEIDKMRTAGRLAAQVLEMITPYVKPGVTTSKLEQICRRFIVEDLQAIPSTLGQQGFPACICTSVNHVVCHGIPQDSQAFAKRRYSEY